MCASVRGFWSMTVRLEFYERAGTATTPLAFAYKYRQWPICDSGASRGRACMPGMEMTASKRCFLDTEMRVVIALMRAVPCVPKKTIRSALERVVCTCVPPTCLADERDTRVGVARPLVGQPVHSFSVPLSIYVLSSAFFLRRMRPRNLPRRIGSDRSRRHSQNTHWANCSNAVVRCWRCRCGVFFGLGGRCDHRR